MVQKYPGMKGGSGSSVFDSKEREGMILKYAYLVKHIAGRMAVRLPSSVIYDELVSAGCMGLIDAVDKFDPEKDVSLKTYAQFRIKGAILDELRSMDWYSRSMRKKIQDIEKAVAAVEAREGRPAEDLEVAGELGVDIEKYQAMLGEIHSAALLSLDSFIKNDSNGDSTGRTFKDRMQSSDDPVGRLAAEELKKILAEAIKSLSEKEQITVSLYYYEELTLKEIGEVLGLTESRICQIHTMAIIKLKNKIKAYRDH